MDYINSVKVRLTYKEINEGKFSLLKTKGRVMTNILSFVWILHIILSTLILPTTAHAYVDTEAIMTDTNKIISAFYEISSELDDIVTESDTKNDSETESTSKIDTTKKESNTETETDTTYDTTDSIEYNSESEYIESIEAPAPIINEENTGEYRYNPTEDELYYFYRVVQCEIGGGTYESKLRVCQVILNRIESSRFSNNMMDVLFAPGQFAVVGYGTIYNCTPSEDTIKACNESLRTSTPDYSNGALFFMQGVYDFSWATYLFTDENGHSFYK